MAFACNHGSIPAEFHWNISSLDKPDWWVEVRADCHIKAASLNLMTVKAAMAECEKLVFMDVDMLFPADTLRKLIEDDLPVVSGLYHLKKYPFSPVAGWNGKQLDDGTYERVNNKGERWKDCYAPFPTDQRLVRVDWCGIGCLMVDMDVFDKVGFPAFRDIWDDQKGDRKVGHDILFCDQLREAGYDIHVDTTVDCAHVSQIRVNRLWAEAFHRSNFREVLREISSPACPDGPASELTHQ